LDQKYELVFRALAEIQETSGGNALDFEGFLKSITEKIVIDLLIVG
jgi:hypothetical protein